MRNESLRKKRIIDTFAARNLRTPDDPDSIDSIDEYSLRKGLGLGLRRRRKDRNKKTVI